MCISQLLLAQGEINEQDVILFKNERTVGLYLNTNGYGLNHRREKRINAYKRRFWDFDFMEIKHPKEIKQTSDYSLTIKRFVFGKVNNFYVLRTGIGFQKELYSKFDKNAIAIRRFYAAGLSLGILKPIYYKIWYDDTIPGRIFYKYEKFDLSNSQHRFERIVERAPFFYGTEETTVTPGAFFKFGYSFEYSKDERLIRAVEAGLVVESFLLKATIMDTDDDHWLAPVNDRLFLTLFITYRFGKIVEKR